jgi:predicted 3-demethylubiquinone-9 3-methyltransferase (glyoxalase superfamily)
MSTGGVNMAKNRVCLWYDHDAEEAARFYTATPRVLTDALGQGGDAARRAFEAMLPMQKIDVAAIEAAVRG